MGRCTLLDVMTCCVTVPRFIDCKFEGSFATAEYDYTYMPFDHWLVPAVVCTCEKADDRCKRLVRTFGLHFPIAAMSGASFPKGENNIVFGLDRVVGSSDVSWRGVAVTSAKGSAELGETICE